VVTRGATRRGRVDMKLGWTGAATCLVCCATGQWGRAGVGGPGIPLRWQQIERFAGGGVSQLLDVIYPFLQTPLFSVFTWKNG